MITCFDWMTFSLTIWMIGISLMTMKQDLLLTNSSLCFPSSSVDLWSSSSSKPSEYRLQNAPSIIHSHSARPIPYTPEDSECPIKIKRRPNYPQHPRDLIKKLWKSGLFFKQILYSVEWVMEDITEWRVLPCRARGSSFFFVFWGQVSNWIYVIIIINSIHITIFGLTKLKIYWNFSTVMNVKDMFTIWQAMHGYTLTSDTTCTFGNKRYEGKKNDELL